MLDATFMVERRRELRAREVANKPSTVQIKRGGAVVATVIARVNFPSYASRTAQSAAADAAIVALTVASDDPALDIRRDDRVVCTDSTSGKITTGKIIAVRPEPWGVEADASSEQ